jgi:hypothetical protein
VARGRLRQRLGGASLEAGSSRRATIIARTNRPPRCSPSRRSKANPRKVPSTAATWPCGQARRIANGGSPSGSTVPPCNSARIPSTSAGGQSLRLSRVRFLTLPPSRKLSRSRMAGGELRFGTASMYMAERYAPPLRYLQPFNLSLHGYKRAPKSADSAFDQLPLRPIRWKFSLIRPTRCFSLFFHKISSERPVLFCRNPGVRPPPHVRKQRRAPLILAVLRCFYSSCRELFWSVPATTIRRRKHIELGCYAAL